MQPALGTWCVCKRLTNRLKGEALNNYVQSPSACERGIDISLIACKIWPNAKSNFLLFRGPGFPEWTHEEALCATVVSLCFGQFSWKNVLFVAGVVNIDVKQSPLHSSTGTTSRHCERVFVVFIMCAAPSTTSIFCLLRYNLVGVRDQWKECYDSCKEDQPYKPQSTWC